MQDSDALKRAAGQAAAKLVTDGMLVGLGSGSTLVHAIRAIGERVSQGKLRITGVATSWQAHTLARECRIPLIDPADVDMVDLAIDGADAIDPAGNCIKGGGAAHVTEKIVAAMAKQFVLVADESKLVKVLGPSFPVPIEVVAPAVSLATSRLRALGARAELRVSKGKMGPVISDLGHPVMDAWFPAIDKPAELDAQLNAIPGLVGHGLFVEMCWKAVIAYGGADAPTTRELSFGSH